MNRQEEYDESLGGSENNTVSIPNVWQCRFFKYFHLHFCLMKSLNRKYGFYGAGKAFSSSANT